MWNGCVPEAEGSLGQLLWEARGILVRRSKMWIAMWWRGTLIPYLSTDNELALEEESPLDFCQSVNITILVVLSRKKSHIRIMTPMHLTQRCVSSGTVSSHLPAKHFEQTQLNNFKCLELERVPHCHIPFLMVVWFHLLFLLAFARYIFFQDMVRTWVTLHMAVFASPVRVARSLLATWHGSQHVSRMKTVSRLLDRGKHLLYCPYSDKHTNIPACRQ